ncbi:MULTISPECIES: thiamine-phosphate kinase [Lysobacter]|uniref:Thiamine-monophosphate kinase n=1 Tax=Lysobacter firmicutimachus TaxID=1792846 RepID=A0ABU8CZ42_9GAMM|nr:thiamine-phosphate kinase [Lysobacter antibioticus]
MSAAEFDLIARIRARAGVRDDVALGIGDDAALLQPPPGRQLVVATDTLNRGVHFGEGAAAADIGWKSLAVNLSDLAAMGAEPAWCTLSLSLPTQADNAAFVDAFLDGFLDLAAQHRVALVGGDTTRGPLSVCVTVLGLVAPGAALRRDAAQPGDEIWVTGTLGDAAAALALDGIAPYREQAVRRCAGDPATDAARLHERLARPTPRVAAGRSLAGLASAGIDVSDGLLADLGHVCAASQVAARIELALLPVSPALAAAAEGAARWQLQAAGGDDYELCFTAVPERRTAIERALAEAAVPGCRIGRIEAGRGVRAFAPDGTPWRPARTGYEHFAG